MEWRGVLALGSTDGFLLFAPEERKKAVSIIAKFAAEMSAIENDSDIRPEAAIELGRSAAHYRAAARAFPALET